MHYARYHESQHIVRSLTCTSCGSVNNVRMERYWMQYDWVCSICGKENHYVRPVDPLIRDGVIIRAR